MLIVHFHTSKRMDGAWSAIEAGRAPYGLS